DVGNSFTPSHLPDAFKEATKGNFFQYNAKKMLPINIFEPKNYAEGDDLDIETDQDIINRISQMLKDSLKLGDQQYMAVQNSIKDCFSICRAENKPMTLEILCEYMNYGKGPYKSAASKISAIVNTVKFSDSKNDLWPNILSYDNPKMTVFQLSNLNSHSQKITTDCILNDLMCYISINGSVNKPFILIIDEMQNINTNFNSPIGKFLVESRKFGASLILSSQFVDFNKNNPVIVRQLQQAATRIYFRPCDWEIPRLAKYFSSGGNLKWKEILKTMKVGYCVVENGNNCDELNKLVKVLPIE
ncbi:MAG: hypothetical protein ACI4VF_09145, partial [Lachnospirales bacterium]